MKVFILKTDLNAGRKFRQLGRELDKHHQISRWAIDLDDIDRVLKLETNMEADQSKMIAFIRSQGIYCETLPDE